MNKSLLAIATAILAATTLFASAAEAGFKVRLGFGGPLPSFTAHGNSGGYHKPRRKRSHIVRRKAKSKVHVTKKTSTSKSSDVAKVEDKPEEKPAQKAAVNENSSISTAALPKAEETIDETAKATTETTETATAAAPDATKKLDCKKFFPSVGMTLTVPCQ
jgi:hypothetical protein